METLATIGVDLDGVVHNFAVSFYDYLLHNNDPNIPKDFDGLEVKYDFFTEWGIDHETYKNLHDDAIIKGFAYNGPLIDDAANQINRLYEAGHKIHIITARPKKAALTTMKWILKHEIPFHSLTFSENKALIKTDAFIEDNEFNYKTLEESGSVPFLVDRGWNRDAKGLFRRVENIGEFVDLVIGATGQELRFDRIRWSDKFEFELPNVWY